MTNAATTRTAPRGGDGADRDPLADRGEQLTLLPTSNVHARFRLSRATRERGLRHVAEIREQLAERRAAQQEDNVHRLPPRRPDKAA